tara:strand:- start:43 stop:261 length:219 start_codon:yes stop_codon:yes gene_type:complete
MRLNPDSLWAGPPAWELEDLLIFLFFFIGRARLAARSAFNCENVLLIKQHHILLWKVAAKPIAALLDFVIVF